MTSLPASLANLTTLEFLKNDTFWIHAKNIDAMYELIHYDVKCFFHQSDLITLTSNNLIWTYPGQQLTSLSIAVVPETVNYSKEQLNNCWGVCSDFISKY